MFDLKQSSKNREMVIVTDFLHVYPEKMHRFNNAVVNKVEINKRLCLFVINRFQMIETFHVFLMGESHFRLVWWIDSFNRAYHPLYFLPPFL